MAKTATIKPCPFCGSHNLGYHGDTTDFLSRDRYWVYCMRCEAQGPKADSREEAVKRWDGK